MRIARSNQMKQEELEQSMYKIMSSKGDHYTNLKIYNKFISPKGGPGYILYLIISWAKANHINIRALKQAINIRNQISELTSSINLKTVKSAFSSDPIYILYKSTSASPGYELSTRISLCLTSSFFSNASRLTHSSSTPCYMLLSLGTTVSLCASSSYSVLGLQPRFIVFTELAGSGSGRGTVRGVSEAKKEWVEGYARKAKMFKGEILDSALGKRELPCNDQLTQKIHHTQHSETPKLDKVGSARDRFLERKRMREVIGGM